MLRFEDFFPVPYPDKTKVKFNMLDGSIPAWDYLKQGEQNPDWIRMNAHRRKQASNNLDKAQYLLAFAQYYPYGKEYYIFGGMYEITIIQPEIINGQGYSLKLLPEFEDYRKRLIIRLNKPIGRDTYARDYSKIQTDSKLDPEMYEISPQPKLDRFPGYNNVCLTHAQLQSIVKNDAPEWRDALSKVKGVYCVTDTRTGKIYIGSAYGEGGIWQRWANYANCKRLTGGNKYFENIKKTDEGYIINNFQYTILEIFDMKAYKDYIIGRENYWKEVFKTRQFGMNAN